MNEITFPEVTSATFAILGLNAALALAPTSWPPNEQIYYLDEAVPTVSTFQVPGSDVLAKGFASEITSVFSSLSLDQQPLGSEFEAIWDSNLEALYES